MTRLLPSLVALLLVLSLSGCEATGDKVGQAAKSIVVEFGEAYENVVTKITNVRNWLGTKVNQVDRATENISEAADSLGEAVDSIKAVTGE